MNKRTKSPMSRTHTSDCLETAHSSSFIDNEFSKLEKTTAEMRPDLETRQAQAMREVNQFYESGTQSEVDDLLSQYELETQASCISKELTFAPDDLLDYVIIKMPEFEKLGINMLDIGQIIRELTIGIFVYNSLPSVEFLPCKQDIQTSRVHIPMPYKNTKIGCLMFKLLYKTNLIYHGSRFREESAGADGEQRKVYTDSFAYRRGMYERYEKKVVACQGCSGLDSLKNGTIYDSLVQSLVDVDLIQTKTPPSLAEKTREFTMQANPKSQSPSAEFEKLLEHHFFEINLSTHLEQDLDSSKRSIIIKATRDFDKPVTMDVINPIPEKIIAPEIFDRFQRIIEFHKDFVLEKLEKEALTGQEKYLLHFSNALVGILIRLKKRGFMPRVDDLFYMEIMEKHANDINEKVPCKIPPFITAGPFAFKQVMRGRGRLTLGHNLSYLPKNPDGPKFKDPFGIQTTLEAIKSKKKSSIFGTVWFSVQREASLEAEKEELVEAHKSMRDSKLFKRNSQGGKSLQKSAIWSDLREVLEDFTDPISGYVLPGLERFRSESLMEACRSCCLLGRGVRLFHVMIKLMKGGEGMVLDQFNKTLMHYCCAYNRPFMVSALLKTAADFTVGRVNAKTIDRDFSTTAVHESIRCNAAECFKKLVETNQKRRKQGIMKMEVLSLLNYEHHFPVHSIVRYNRTRWLEYFNDLVGKLLSKDDSPGVPTNNQYYLVHLAAMYGNIDYMKNFTKMDDELYLETGKDCKSVLHLAIEYQQVKILQFFKPFERKQFVLDNLKLSLPMLTQDTEIADDEIILAVASEVCDAGNENNFFDGESLSNIDESFLDDAITVLANSILTRNLNDSTCIELVKVIMYKWMNKTANLKSKILIVLTDLVSEVIETRKKYSTDFINQLETSCNFLINQNFTIISTVSQLYLLISKFLAIPSYDHSNFLDLLSNERIFDQALKHFYTAVDQKEDMVVVAVLRFYTAVSHQSEILRNKFLNEPNFINTCLSLLSYQQSDQVCVVACHFFYAFCDNHRKIQLKLISSPIYLQEKIRPVLRNFKTEVKIAAVRATWSLVTGQNENKQRRVAAKFGMREINRMLMSTPREQEKSDQALAVRAECHKLQGLGMTVLRAYCKKWATAQMICSEKETLVNLRCLIMRYLKPGESSPTILLLKSIRDLLSIDGLYLVNTKVKHRLISSGIVPKLIDAWRDYKLSFSSEMNLLILGILNLTNDDNWKIEMILNEAVPFLIIENNFETLITLAHYSVERTNMINLSWYKDVLPAIENTENGDEVNYKQQAALVSFIIFCSARILDIDSTTAVAACFKKLYAMLASGCLKSQCYASNIVSSLPLIGLNYLNALAENGIISLFIEAFESTSLLRNRVELENSNGSKNYSKSELSELQIEKLEEKLAGAIATFTVELTGRRLVLCELRKRPELIGKLIKLIEPDSRFWDDVTNSTGSDDLPEEAGRLAVPELCVSMNSDFIPNLKFLQKKALDFSSGFSRAGSRMGSRVNSGVSRLDFDRSKTVSTVNSGDFRKFSTVRASSAKGILRKSKPGFSRASTVFK